MDVLSNHEGEDTNDVEMAQAAGKSVLVVLFCHVNLGVQSSSQFIWALCLNLVYSLPLFDCL